MLPPSTVELLRERKESSMTEWIFPDPLKPEQPPHPIAAHERTKVLLKQAGLPDLRFQELRHTFAIHALASSVDIKTLSGILGHVSSATTLNTYSHVTDEMRQRAAARIALGIARAKATEQMERPKEPTMAAFQVRKRWSRQTI